MSSAGGLPAADVTGRMAMFGRIFAEQVGMEDPASVASARDLVGIVRERVPRVTDATTEAPVFEAAAYVGEWLRGRCEALWVAEGPFEPHLQLTDESRSVVYLLPLISIMRTASTAGYDGLAASLETVLHDVAHRVATRPLDRLRVLPMDDRARIVEWVRRHMHIRDAARAALWRRCDTCSRLVEESVTLHLVHDDWEAEAATAATILTKRPFDCACGGAPGEDSRFLMLRNSDEGTGLCDIHVTGAFSRVACWQIRDDLAIPVDATLLATEGIFG